MSNGVPVSAKTIKREIIPGDVICALGHRWTVKKILSQDCYVDKSCFGGKDRSSIDIEFKDLNGVYHHWKSHLDGGIVVYKETNKDECMFNQYYSQEKNGYVLDPNIVANNYSLSQELVSLISKDYLLTYDGGMYLLREVNSCKEVNPLKVCANRVYDLLHEAGCHYAPKFSFEEYSSKDAYQDAIDFVLRKGAAEDVSGYHVGMVVRKNAFVLVEYR